MFLCLSYDLYSSTKYVQSHPIIRHKLPKLSQSNIDLHNHSFVYFTASNIMYPYLDIDYFNIGQRTAIFEPHFFKSYYPKQHYAMSSSTWYNVSSLNEQYYQETPIEVDKVTIKPELFSHAEGKTIFIPNSKELHKFEQSQAYADGYRYLADGWFYKSTGYDIMQTFEYYMDNSESGTTHYFVGGDIFVTIIFELITFLINMNKRSSGYLRTKALNRLFENPKNGDIKVQFYTFNPSSVSIVAFKKARTLNYGTYKSKPFGKLTAGIVSSLSVMRPPFFGDNHIFSYIKFIMTILYLFVLKLSSNSAKELCMNLLLTASFIFMLRSMIFNAGYLNPILGVSLFSILSIIYSRM